MTTSVGCIWCRAEDHDVTTCGRAKAYRNAVHPVLDPRSDADDAIDALRDRMHGWRTVCGQLLREMKQGGLTPSPATLDLFPEPLDP